MGTISNSLSSSSANSASSAISATAPVTVSGANTSNYFTGSSQYSQDFQDVITRAVNIADLPIQLLTNRQNALSAQSGELQTLDSKFSALQNAVQEIATAMSGAAYQATVSDPKSVTASISDGAAEGVYSIQVDNIGTYATSISSQSWNSTPHPSGAPAYSLVVGGKSYALAAPADNSAASVAASIDAQYGNLVSATAVNVGSSATPDWRISLQSATLDNAAVDLQVAGLQQQQTASGGLTTSMSANTWSSAAGSTTYTVTAGGSKYTIKPADNSVQTVADAINSIAGNPVQATVVDLGTAGTHDYRIEMQSSASGPLDIQQSMPVSLQTQQQTGQNAKYEVAGLSTPVYSNSRSVTISHGVTLQLQGTSSGEVNVVVSRATSALNTALSDFTSAYNAVVDELVTQRGQSGGALAGQSIVNSLSQTLRSISTYSSGTGQINGLASLGLDLGTDGHITYNALQLMGADLSNSRDVTAFLGSATGGGFLKVATDALKSLEDPFTGLIKTSETNLNSEMSDIGGQITTKQNQVSQLQQQLTQQMAAADALIATMEQQYTYLSDMFQAQQTADQMYK